MSAVWFHPLSLLQIMYHWIEATGELESIVNFKLSEELVHAYYASIKVRCKWKFGKHKSTCTYRGKGVVWGTDKSNSELIWIQQNYTYSLVSYDDKHAMKTTKRITMSTNFIPQNWSSEA